VTPHALDPKIPRELGGLEKGDLFHEASFRLGDPAAPALAGIRASDIADKIETYERLYQKELRQFPAEGLRRSIATVLGVDCWRRANSISRMELKDLALAHATLLNLQGAQKAQADMAKQYMDMAGALADLYSFLFQNFPDELARGQASGQSLFQVAKRVMLGDKK
jgi:hypothetical protein